jgi:uncharacterized membrane protein
MRPERPAHASVITFRGFARPVSHRADPARNAVRRQVRWLADLERPPAKRALHSAPIHPAAAPEYAVTARESSALSRRSRLFAFGLAAAASLAVALAFVAAGAWPVLPYSLIEIAVLAGAFALVERRSRSYETLVVDGDRVIVERGDGRARERREFNRYWLRVELRESRGGAPAVELRYAGEAIGFGRALPPGQRAEVARTLQRLVAAR